MLRTSFKELTRLGPWKRWKTMLTIFAIGSQAINVVVLKGYDETPW